MKITPERIMIACAVLIVLSMIAILLMGHEQSPLVWLCAFASLANILLVLKRIRKKRNNGRNK